LDVHQAQLLIFTVGLPTTGLGDSLVNGNSLGGSLW
jgi:hypothetical protein